MDSLSKKQITQIQSLYTKHGRKKSDLCVVEGVRVCEEIFNRLPNLVQYTLVTKSCKQKLSIPGIVYEVEEQQLQTLSSTIHSQGILTIVKKPVQLGDEILNSDKFILALDQIGDPGNFGTICRTALSAGLHELWYTKGSVDPFSDKVIRSAMGSQFFLNLREFEDLKSLVTVAQEQKFNQICLTKVDRGESCFVAEKLFDKSVIVIGSEGHGVSHVDDARDITIPMPGKFESLNAAQGATIILFEYVRRLTHC